MKIQYPKLLALLVCIIAAYILFQTSFFQEFAWLFNSHGYFSIFLAGFLFTYGFTAPFAVGLFVSLAPQVDIFLAALLGGIGAVIADLLIFQFIRTSFQNEFDRFKLTWLFQKIHDLFHRHCQERLKKYLLYVVGGFLIASPLPDEFGVSLISGFTNLDTKVFSVIAYLLNTTGILIILALAS